MNINWDKKYNTIAVYTFVVIALSIMFYNVFSNINIYTGKFNEVIDVFQPFIIGFIIAYLLNFIVKFYENKVFKLKGLNKIKKSAKRKLGILFSYITAGLLLYLFMQFIMPQLFESIKGLIEDIPKYISQLTVTVEEHLKQMNINEGYIDIVYEKFIEITNWMLELLQKFLPILGGTVISVASSIWNIILGIIISIYLLIDKEKFFALSKKLINSLFDKKKANTILLLTQRVNFTFSKYIGGMILDSIIIGIFISIILSILKFPYALLIGTIVGCTNVIPFFGPFIGAIPSAIILLFVSPIQALWFLVIILITQQIDGNIIAPKILGDTIGISPFWVLFAILVAGELFGLVGAVIGVPMFAVIYSIIKELVESRLKDKGFPSETENYLDL